MPKPDWAAQAHQLLEEARKHMSNACKGVPTFIAAELQRRAILCLMEAVELHNDNFRFKVGANGTKTKTT